MWVRFRVSFHSFIDGPSPESLNLETKFKHRLLLVTATFEGNETYVIDESSDMGHVRKVTGLVITVEGVRTVKNHRRLLGLLTLVANRILGAIRNFGKVVYVKPVTVDYSKATVEDYLRAWEVEVSQDLKEWKSLATKPKDRSQLMGYARALGLLSEEKPSIRSCDWAAVEKGLNSCAEVTPHVELLVNTLEHLGRRNYRLAVLEAVTCLEVTLNGYLRKYFSISKKLPEEIVDFVLDPRVGLKDRIKKLMIPSLALGKDTLDSVVQVLHWRNGVVHRSGRLPLGIADSEKKEKILEVLGLAMLLRREM